MQVRGYVEVQAGAVCKTAPFALLPPDPTARARFFAELAPSYALEWLICASRIPLAPGDSRAPIRSERVDSSHANQVSHAPWQITLDKLAWENRGPLPVTAEVPLGEGSEQMVAGVEREAPMRIACGPTGRPLLPVRMEVADTAVEEIMATTLGVPVKRLILVTRTHYQDQPDELSYRIKALDPDARFDEQFDEQLRRLRAERDRLKALPAEPNRWDEQPTWDLYADIYQALPPPNAARD